MLMRVLLVALAFYAVAALLMVGQRPGAAPAAATSWWKYGSYGALLCVLLALPAAGRPVYAVALTALVGWALIELYAAAGLPPGGRLAATSPGVLLCVLALAAGARGLPLAAALGAVGALVWNAVRPPRNVGDPRVLWIAIGTTAIALPAAHLLLLTQRGATLVTDFAFLVLVVCASDSFAELVGRRWGLGRGLLRASPGKSVSGLAGGLAAALAMAAALSATVGAWSMTGALRLGLVLWSAAVAGDLLASSLKRQLGIKDFGATLPGHGGALDRFDSLFLAAWPYYWMIRG